MFERTYYATHPDMMECVSNEELRDRYLIQGLFREGEVVLNYTHADRFVIGGVAVGAAGGAAARTGRAGVRGGPAVPRAARTGDRQRRRRPRRGHGRRRALRARQQGCLYVTMGASDVIFSGGARASTWPPARRTRRSRRASCRSPRPMRWSAAASRNSNERTIYQLVIPGVCDSAQLVMGLTVLKPGSVWNTMPPHIHERRSEIYFYFDLDGDNDRVFHFMGEGEAMRHIVVANEEAVISPVWSIHMGAGHQAYAFIWAMAGENQDYTDMNVLDICQLQ